MERIKVKKKKILRLPNDSELEGIVITNENGEILNVNEIFRKITGYTSQEVIGKNPRILKSGKHDNAFYKNMWDLVRSEGYWHGYIWNKRKNGEIYLECLTINSINSMTGTKYYIATFKEAANCESEIDSCSKEQKKSESLRNTYFITENELHYAIEKKEFIIHYQPLLSIRDKRYYGIEALLRWNHPVYGLISPMEFIPLAETTGLIIPLTKWLMEKSIAEIKVLHQQGFRDLKILINISVKHFQEANFIEMLRYVLEKNNLEPNFLELEITESIFLQPTNKIIKKMKELKNLGIRLSIDDFGTGYSSLQYLRYFPFDSLKIDKTFLQGVNKDKVNKVIVESIIRMGKSLNMNIIAEGVETEQQAFFLEKKRCDIIQGYLLSRPLILNELINFLTNNKYLLNYKNGI